MSLISKDEVKKVARLARIEVSEAELSVFQKELENVLEYVEQLKTVNTDGVEPTYQPSALPEQKLLDNATRSDRVIPSDKREKLLDAAPERDGDFVRVKSVLK